MLSSSDGQSAWTPLLWICVIYGAQSDTEDRRLLEVEHLPPLSLGAELVLALGLEDGGVVLPTHARLLDRLGVGLGQRTEPT